MAEIKIEEISLTFQEALSGEARIILDNINCVISDGEFVCVTGPSGCGKSTLLNVVGGLITANYGRIVVGGREVSSPGPDRGMVFQNYSLYPWLTVRQNIEFGPTLSHWDRTRRREVSDRLIDLVGLNDYCEAYPKALSGGMRQRVAIARAIAMEPKVLLMDEPFGALDAQTRSRMQELLLDVWTRRRTTVIFVTHDVEEAVFLADRVLVMSGHSGKIEIEETINLPRPRRMEILSSEAFSQYRLKIMSALRH